MLPGGRIHEARKREYYEKGYWTTRTVYDVFMDAVQQDPEKVAIVDVHQKVTYAQLHELVIKTSRMFVESGIKKGDTVAVQLPNWLEYVVFYLSSVKIGAVFCPIPITARQHEVRYMINLCEAKLCCIPVSFRNHHFVKMYQQLKEEISLPQVIVIDKYHEVSEEQVLPADGFVQYEPLLEQTTVDGEEITATISADDPLVVLFTSGTESEPKGVIHTHNTVLFGERTMRDVLKITSDDVVFMPSPLSHATGFLHGVNLPILVGGKMVLMDRFQAADALKMISEEKCTFSMGATPFLHDIFKEMFNRGSLYDLSSFRFFLCGGAPIPRHIAAEATKIGFKVLAVYGSTESPPHAVSRLEDEEELIISTDGKPMPGIEVKVVDDQRQTLPVGKVGEIASRGPNVFVGYLKRPDLTERYLDEDGWYYSGDYGILNEHGYVKIVGRKKDMIIRGGQNISPGEVEQILYKHPKIDKVAVVGMPDERMGEKVCAFVVTKNGESLTLEEVVDYLAQHQIAKYKYPERLELVDELPMTASGKIQKYLLREKLKIQLGYKTS